MTGSPFTGDHLYSVMRYLKRLSIREKIQSFDKSHLFEALRGGPKQKKLTEREKKVVSIHEAGHAVVALSVKESTPVERISIDSDFAESLGFTEQQKHPDQFVITKRQLLADMMILFGGREAELMVFNDNSIGSENDLQRANYICKEMVEHLGMTDGMGVWSRLSGCSYSEFLQQRRDKICLEMLEASRRKCREILEARRDLVERIAEVLLAEKTINRERLESILSERST
jgi:cell division protease FtsH